LQLRQLVAVGDQAPAEVVPVAFQRYKPHMLLPGMLPAGTAPGIHDVSAQTPLYRFCKTLCQTGGNWIPAPNPIAGYRLVAVQAVLHDNAAYAAYEYRQAQKLNQRMLGGQHFNFATADRLAFQQLQVLASLREQFQERMPGTNPLAVNTFYCFHGPRREHVNAVCTTGLVATRAMDSGYFGSGCYSTLNLEYAVKYSRGEFDDFTKRRPPTPDGRYPVILFAASVGMAYPVTRDVDYPAGANQSNFFGRPLQPGFDCHVVCVNQTAGYQAVNRSECQYVEVVIDQESQMLPLAVLWFEEL
jgi:hypothetical protein